MNKGFCPEARGSRAEPGDNVCGDAQLVHTVVVARERVPRGRASFDTAGGGNRARPMNPCQTISRRLGDQKAERTDQPAPALRAGFHWLKLSSVVSLASGIEPVSRAIQAGRAS